MRLEDLAPAGISFVVVALIIGIGADVLQSAGTKMAASGPGTTNTTAQAVIDNGTAGMAELSSWLPTIALVIAAAVIIGVVVSYFAMRN